MPRLHVRLERVLVEQAEDGSFEPEDVPVMELSFRYGDQIVRCQPADDLFEFSDDLDLDDQLGPLRESDAPPSGCRERAEAGGLLRDDAYEERCKCLLESFGAVELGCIETYVAEHGSTANYAVKVDGDVHTFCSFGAYALPQLRKLGWEVIVDDAYPYKVLSGDVPWYALAQPQDDQPDWFSFEMGIVIGGKRVSLLAALVDILDKSPDEGSLEALLKHPSRFLAVPAGDDVYVPVPADRLRRVLRVLTDLYDGRPCAAAIEDGVLSLPLGDASALGDLAGLDDANGRFEVSGCDVVERSIALSSRPPASAAPTLRGLRATLRGYQQEGVAWLQQLRELGMGGVLADDMGLGKTLQTIAHLLSEKEAGRLDHPCLIVAPTSLVGNWSREIKKFAPVLRTLILHGAKRHAKAKKLREHHIVITTYGLVQRDQELLEQHKFHMLVLDEAQAIKNPRSRAHQSVQKINATHKLCLTGTPVENHLGELHALFALIVPGLLGSAEDFRHRYRLRIEQGDEERLEQLRRRVSPFILRRLKQDVAHELPPKTEIVRPVDLDGDQRELYEGIRVAAHAEVRQLIRKKGLAASTVPVLDALMKLRQVCCDPRLVRVAAARKVKRSAKYEALLELIQTQLREGRRILVFSQFTSMLDLISAGLFSAGIDHVTLTGATINRQAKVDAFQEGRVDVFLISLKAGGTGLNLTRADTVIHYDPWWNPAAQAQATDRAYRIGQKQPVFVYNLIVAGSVEERMLQLQQRKRHLADSILGQGGSTGALEASDVDNLFAPLDD